MTPEILSTAFIGIISLWAVWCVLSCKVRDGVFGKIIYAVIAIAGYAIVTRSQSIIFTPTVAGITFHAGIAMAGLRHYFLATHWARVKAWICKYLHCEQCSNSDGKNH